MQAVYANVPVVSPQGQRARLVIDTPMEVSAWLNGKAVVFSSDRQDQGEPQAALVELPKGSSRLLIRLVRKDAANAQAVITTTLIADQPVGFDSRAVAPP